MKKLNDFICKKVEVDSIYGSKIAEDCLTYVYKNGEWLVQGVDSDWC